MSALAAADLRPIDLFDDLDDEALARWAAVAELRQVQAGGVLADPEGPTEGVILLLEGTAQAFSLDPATGAGEPVSDHAAPTWIGAIGGLLGERIGVRMQARTDVRYAVIPIEPFNELVLAERAVLRRILRQVRPVMTRITALEQNRDRLAALGTMAAGLAHELNNPAAAAQRAAKMLAYELDVLASTIERFVEAGLEREDAQELVELQREALAAAAERGPLSGLDAADAEDELRDALEDLGIEHGWKLAEPLAAAGVDAAWLQRLADRAGAATDAALAWVAASLTARGLAAELDESTQRMSHLVGAVKTYAYMDRGGLVEADLHEGLDTTLTVLGYKLRSAGVEVVRDYAPDLPKLTVHGSELNQVWTNLIDNAVAAAGDGGTVTVSTALDGPCIRVDIADTGPGIPDDVREHIFEPFFTTKPPGQGTGLGLDTALRIVTKRHRGSIDVESAPGRTVFHVWLPIEETLR
jgi:signal transduction histidine kinase